MNVAEFTDFMNGLAGVVANPQCRDALQDWTDFAKGELDQMMHQQVSPDGTPYAPLSRYTSMLKGHSVALFETGELNSSVKGNRAGHIEQVTNNSARLGTAHTKNGEPVAARMQHGSGKIPARPFIGVNDKMADDAAERIGDDVNQQIDQL
ncbi:Phage virion morphogenesis family protein [Thalassoglobus neptunius]|uniref:Phage virion morphogenesis family protein n=1 Tax=Thalassoglobus neptunius TaxID=1938619 RepID=A0A5C5X7G2_9PLAN|nr:phage virion morphogenesis protein [Thalassoglobus neptunius]TWT58880.1 Phage virion morphogenesis family protein [Thalassoglobus neptunius]